MKKRVVVIGGGFAGAHAAEHLENDFDVTLIDTKDYFEYTPSILRTLVEPDHIKKIQVLHSHYLKKAKIMREKVVEVTESEVILEKEKVPFDYLLIMTGSRYGIPIKDPMVLFATRANQLRAHHQRLSEAPKVLIIGGGLVGVELAAEIATHYKGKEIIICQAGDKILNRNTDRVIRYAEKFLKKKGVTILYNSKIVKSDKGSYVTEQGEKITADMAFMCVGIVPNSQLLSKNFPKTLAQRGYVKVNEHLQLEGSHNIFVAGDLVNIKEEKTAQNSEIQAKVVVENVKRLAKGKELESYKSKKRLIVLSLGKWKGILIYKKMSWGGLVAGMFKGFVERLEMMKYG